MQFQIKPERVLNVVIPDGVEIPSYEDAPHPYMGAVMYGSRDSYGIMVVKGIRENEINNNEFNMYSSEEQALKYIKRFDYGENRYNNGNTTELGYANGNYIVFYHSMEKLQETILQFIGSINSDGAGVCHCSYVKLLSTE